MILKLVIIVRTIELPNSAKLLCFCFFESMVWIMSINIFHLTNGIELQILLRLILSIEH